ncbi:hypothetical protein GCM10023178_26410 [Actinomadura luteofluorescens]
MLACSKGLGVNAVGSVTYEDTRSREVDVAIESPALGRAVKTRILLPKNWTRNATATWPGPGLVRTASWRTQDACRPCRLPIVWAHPGVSWGLSEFECGVGLACLSVGSRVDGVVVDGPRPQGPVEGRGGAFGWSCESGFGGSGGLGCGPVGVWSGAYLEAGAGGRGSGGGGGGEGGGPGFVVEVQGVDQLADGAVPAGEHQEFE